MPEILVIDDEPNIRRMVGAILSGEGFSVRDAANGAAGVRAAAEREPDAVLLDLMMPGELDGMAALSQLRERFPSLPVVMMSGRAELSDAVRATKLGAFHFLEKPLTHESMLLTIRSALELRQARREAQTLREEFGLTGEMVGSSPAMEQVREMIARIAPSEARVLVMGESGT
ncbi:MAG TPA: response regulator, partial [Gemmatimonadaceae bacterium]|nr:response regulator [Gemmatimonadaceae bacterium]